MIGFLAMIFLSFLSAFFILLWSWRENKKIEKELQKDSLQKP